ncbi:four helix bundle protein [Neolewinella xylanilytica]|uniref:Four helix bundle protein n=1 Tax=Neolewinella xylanilytica TaxID=1514080 RepID=A0A2S6I7C8_9BACT|nr:four helix bundle protein [Neolewinella xylanilytica]PPK87411.1 four helix bundle protein [Neolewinella xylanilytica]
MAYSHFKTWTGYAKARTLATQIFATSIPFPKEERYSLTDQIRRSSRSVCANLGEAYGKRFYSKHFAAKLTDCIGENFETQVWLDFALDCHYITLDQYESLTALSEEVGKLLTYMHQNPHQYIPRSKANDRPH